MIFGKRGCNEDKNYDIKIWTVEGDFIAMTIAEQLTKKEAQTIYNDLKDKMNNPNTKIIEIEVERSRRNKIYCINKDKIVAIRMY